MILVYTGNGKGKTTAALGAAVRALGHGQKVLMVQFFKGEWPVVYGEIETAKRLADLEILQIGKGFVGIMGDDKPIEEHRAAAQEAMEQARLRIRRGRYGLVILDEINVAADLGLVQTRDVLALVEEFSAAADFILTGRNAPAAFVERADLVTEMKEVKHPFQKGVAAKEGIDY